MLRWLSEKKNIIFVVIAIVLLLVLVLIVGVQFFKEEEEVPHIEKEPVVLPGDDELEFANNSSMSAQEVWNLAEEKKEALRSLFYNTVVYTPSSVAPSEYTTEDDEKYAAFAENFFEKLNELVVDDIYNEVLSQMVKTSSGYYIANRGIFNRIYTESAIAESDITFSEFRLILANDEQINANVTIGVCEPDENEETCSYKFDVPFELRKINDVWKVNVFYRDAETSLFYVSSDI